jgi:hypothetical protein
MKFKRRHSESEQGCVLSESYGASDAPPLILPAYRQLLLPACVFVTRDTVCQPRHFLFGKFVRELNCSRRGVREPRFHCILPHPITLSMISCSLIGLQLTVGGFSFYVLY